MTCIESKAPYHQQDGTDLCGNAVAQMMLAAPSLGGRVHPQNEVLHLNRSGSALKRLASLFGDLVTKLLGRWNTSPAALCDALNEKKSEFDDDFVINGDSNTDAGCQRIAHAIVKKRVAVPVVVFGSNHWVAVTAVMLEGDPGAGPPYSIKGFFINNPKPDTPDDRTHKTPDACGHEVPANGSADTYVTMFGWLSKYWKEPCRDLAKDPVFVTITPGPPLAPLPASAGPIGRFAAGTTLPLPLSPNDAVKVAVAGVASHMIMSEGPLAKLIGTAMPTNAGPVGDPDNDDDPTYFLVDVDARDRKTVGLALVDPISGEFLGVQAPASLDVPLPSFALDNLSTVEASIAQFQNMIAFADAVGQVPLGPSKVAKQLVWTPCRQSMSPFYPFLRVDISGKRYFRGQDRVMHRRLDRDAHA